MNALSPALAPSLTRTCSACVYSHFRLWVWNAVSQPLALSPAIRTFSTKSRPLPQHVRLSKRWRTRRLYTDTANVPAKPRAPITSDSEVERAINAILTSTTVPTETDCLLALAACKKAAKQLSSPPSGLQKRKKPERSPTSALLSLHSPSVQELGPERQSEKLSELAYQLVKHAPVFITPDILRAYVELQDLLQQPFTIPEIFDYYANKPVPVEGTTPVRYRKAKPSSVSASVPADIAFSALNSAIRAKTLNVALDVINTTFRAAAYRRSKFVRKALPPIIGVGFTPLAAYTVASQLGDYQNVMEASTATAIAFAGIVSYVVMTGTLGLVALLTANDHMKRVTWVPGVPLRDRWLREDERDAAERLATAWGFKEDWKRGMEEGEEWEELKEWCGWRGMIVDKVALMEGME